MEEPCELERQLQAARNEVKRYASVALRAQQELARERRRRDAEGRREDAVGGLEDEEDDEGLGDGSDSSGEERPAGGSDARVDRAVAAHAKWARKIARLATSDKPRGVRESKEVQASSQREDGTELGGLSGRQGGRGDGRDLHGLKAFLDEQRECIDDLARENARLRDSLRARPTRRELLGCRLEVERLQREVHRLRGRRRTDDAEAKSERLQPFEERLTGASRSALSDRIMDDKLLRLLHVQVESVALQGGGSSRQRSRSTAAATRLRRSFLQDNVFCRLSLDPAALPSVASTENTTGAAEHWDDISRRVGRVCSEIVASCCYALDVEDVAKLPRRVEALQCVAHIAPVYQAFAESVKHQLQRFGKVIVSADRKPMADQKRELDELLEAVKDVLVELDARREQMRPPGSKAHDVLHESMRLLRVKHVDQIAPFIRRMLTSIRAEQAFERDLRLLLDLDDSATRKETLAVVSKLLSELGLLPSDPAPRQTSATTGSRSRRDLR